MAARRSRLDGRALRRRRSAEHAEVRPHLAESLELRAVPGSMLVSLPSILPESKDAQLSSAYAATEGTAQRPSVRYERPRWNDGSDESDVVQRRQLSQLNKHVVSNAGTPEQNVGPQRKREAAPTPDAVDANQLSYRDFLAIRVLAGIGESDESEPHRRLAGGGSGAATMGGDIGAGAAPSLRPVDAGNVSANVAGGGVAPRTGQRPSGGDGATNSFGDAEFPASYAVTPPSAAATVQAERDTAQVSAGVDEEPSTPQPQADTIPAGPGGNGTPPTCAQDVTLPIESGLTGWTVEQFGGSAPGLGGASANAGSATLREGNSFLTTLEHPMAVAQAGMTLSFVYEELSFDTTSTGRMKDAFEVALVGADGEKLVHSFAPERETFVNFSEGEPVGLAQGVNQVGNQVTLDLAEVFAGTAATLSFRLVNNDGDEGTFVRLRDVRLNGGGGDCAPQASLELLNDTAPAGPDVAPLQTDRLTNDARVTGTVSDDQGIALVQVSVDGGPLQDITATVQNGQFTFDPGVLAAGPHTVLLRATDTDGLAADATLEFTVNAPPVASAGGNRTVPEGSIVNFDAGGSTDTEAPIYSYRWTLDDGSTVAGASASRTYSQQGQFTVDLTVTDTAGSTAAAGATITVENAAPVIAPLADQTIDEGGSTSLTAAFTDAGVLDLHAAVIDWGDGAIEPANLSELHGAGAVTASHFYRENGTYSATLTVSDQDGGSASESFVVQVRNRAPSITAVNAPSGQEGAVVSLLASFTDQGVLDTHTATIDWSNGAVTPGVVSEVDGQGTVSASYVYANDGVYPVRVTVLDDDGDSASQAVSAVITNAPAVLAPIAEQTIDEGARASVATNFTDAGVLDVHTAVLDWGDGSVESVNVNELDGLGSVTANHVYRENGVYAGLLTVSDADGGSASQPFLIHVRSLAPRITQVNAPSGQEGSPVALVASFTDAGVLDTHAATVTWSDGSTTPGTVSEVNGQGTVSASHTYADNGGYPVSLTLSDDDGDSVTQSLTAVIGNVPPVVTPAGNQSIGVGALLDLEVATFVDPGFTSPPAGKAETFLATIDWGDGSAAEPGLVSVVNGSLGVPTRGTVHGAHNYSSAGNYQVTVAVRDDDQGQASASFQVVVQQVAVNPCAYVVPGNPGESMEVTFNWVTRDATYNNELGFYPIDGATGAVSGLAPGQAGYAQAALTREQQRIVFTSSDTAGAVAKMTVPAGTLWSPYLVQNSTRDLFLTKNAANALGVSPRSWFCFAGANPDGFDHFRRTDLPNGVVQFAAEDFTSGGDQDFNDLVFTITAAPAAAQPHTKFVTVDSSSDKAFRYDADGAANNSSSLAKPDSGSRGVTMTEAGDRYWVIDGNKQVYVYLADGSLHGTWRPKDLTRPVGIATDGNDLWILDGDARKIKRYAGGAARTFGEPSPSSQFSLHTDNTTPTDMATDGSRFWVTDDGRNEVFIYSTSGQCLGRWKLDTKNADPAGITHEPGSGTNIWVADRVDDRVYKYTGGEAWVSGTRTSASSFALASGNGTVEGIADPPGDYLGTEFWIMSPDRQVFRNPTEPFYIAGPTATQGVLEIPGFGYSQSFSVTPGVVTEVQVPRAFLTAYFYNNANISDTAVRITAQAEVTVTVVNGYSNNTVIPHSSYLALPLDVLGNDYMVMSYKNGYGFCCPEDAAGTGTTLRIVAPFDNTVITINPSKYLAHLQSQWREPYTITLNRGQVFTLNYLSDAPGEDTVDEDFTGTRIVASKPIAVYGENIITTIPNGIGLFSQVLEQLPAIADWDTEFLAVPSNKVDPRNYPNMFPNAREPVPIHLLRFLASEDGTHVAVNGTTVATLNAGEYYELQFDGPTHILANKPILTAQFTGEGENLDLDEYMTIVPGTSQYLSTYEVLVPNFMNSLANCGNVWESGTGTLCYAGWVSLTVPQTALASLSIDGSLVNPAGALPIGTTGFVSLQIDALPGHHRIQAAAPFGAILYGFGATHGIGHPAGIKFVDRNAAPSLVFVSPPEFSQINSEVAVSVLVTGDSGLPLEGIEVNLSVTGANARQLVATTNPAGEAVFRYVGSNAGLDHLTAAVDGATAETDLVWADLALQVEVFSPANETSLDAGATTLISGRVTAAAPYARPAVVRINGKPVDAMDAQGNFFARRAVGQGTNTLLVEAVDTLGQTAAATIDLIGSPTNAQADIYARTSDVTGSLRERYGRTSFNRTTGTLFTEIAVANAGQYEVDAPLVVEVSNLSDPDVRVRGEDGASPAGNAYLDLSAQLVGPTLAPTAVTDRRDLRFALNAPEQFAYDLLIRGQLNRVPQIDSVPPVIVSVGNDYQYNVAASDPDGNALTFRLEAAPAGMIIGATTGALTWSPTGADLGTHQVTVVVDDQRGGRAEQGFTLSVVAIPPNRPPGIRSVPPVAANVLSTYSYVLDAFDPDNSDITAVLLESPAGMSLDSATREIRWTPVAAQVGEHSVRVAVRDALGAEAVQSFTIDVQPAIGNTSPVFTSTPGTVLLPGQSFAYLPRVLDADEDLIALELGVHPSGMSLDAASGVLNWTPTVEQTRKGLGGLVSSGLAGDAYQASSTSNNPLDEFPPVAALAFDGDPDTWWRPDATQPWPQWIEVDLGADFKLNSLSLIAAQAVVGASIHEVWLSDTPIGLDLTNARLAGRVERSVADEETIIIPLDVATRARYMQVRTLEAPTLTGWREIQVFASPEVFAAELVATDGRGGKAEQQFSLSMLGVQPGEIRGYVFDDANANRVRDLGSSEPGLPGWTVYLDANGNGQLDFGEAQTVADASGDYVFTDVVPGHYVVRQRGRQGWSQTAPADGEGYAVDLSAGQVHTGISFGLTGGSLTNRAPVVISVPLVTRVAWEGKFEYQVAAHDEDGDALTFDLPLIDRQVVVLDEDGEARTLVVPHEDVQIDPVNGKFVFFPKCFQLCPREDVPLRFLIRARDENHGVALQTINVTAFLEKEKNTAPVFHSTLAKNAYADVPYLSETVALDADSDPVNFLLAAHPAGMSIDSATGRISWTPNASQLGTHTGEIVVQDGRGGEGRQTFSVTVNPFQENAPPVITSSPRTVTPPRYPYKYRLTATDSTNDPITFVIETAPAGMVLNGATLFWGADYVPAGGVYPVTIRAEDGRGGVARQSFSIEVNAGVPNHPMQIVSVPEPFAVVGRLYEYDLRAFDADNDPPIWNLVSRAPGMTLDFQRGTLRWLPTADQVGTYSIRIFALDGLTGGDSQEFQLTVLAKEPTPAITSVPETSANVSQTYVYAVRAENPAGGPLAFTLGEHPIGMSIDSSTGLILWTPDATQVGSHAVTVRVTTESGAQASQSFTVVATADALTLAPVFVSTPLRFAVADTSYRYRAVARDPEAETLTYSLRNAPTGMAIDAATGEITWLPSAAAAGPHAVVVTATDPAGNLATQGYQLLVTSDNAPPEITSQPLGQAAANAVYRYEVRTTDPDGDPVRFALTDAPLGMTIDQFGRVRWQPNAANLGSHRVEITVSDGHGGSATQEFQVEVIADTLAPLVSLEVTPPLVGPGDNVLIVARAVDDIGVANLRVTVDGTQVVLDANGSAVYRATGAGVVSVLAVASDAAGNNSPATAEFLVRDLSDPDAPTALISDPLSDAVITRPTDVLGTVDDTNLQFYRLEYALYGTENFTEFARGSSTVNAGVLGTFDPSLLANDTYTIRLTAFDSAGNSSSDEVVVSVAGELKLGNFTLSFTDLSIPVSGVPITVSRTYDSLNSATSDDFGYGWRMEFRDVDLRTSVAKTGYEEDFIYNPFREGSRVYVTLPGGKREGFTFKPKLSPSSSNLCALNFCLIIYEPHFEPDPGVHSQLSVPKYSLRLDEFGQAQDYLTGEPFNPSSPLFGHEYTVTTEDGLEYKIDALTGDLTSVTDPNANRLTFTDSAIESSTGKRVTFERNPQGRITAVVDPSGDRVQYQYNAAGDLVRVIDRAGNDTEFRYASPRPHYLTEVIDPLGRTGVRSEYDADGRLVRMVDADGEDIRLVHDPDNSLETVYDQLDHPTIYEYDERGNVVHETTEVGGVTQVIARTYDLDNNMLTETDALGRTTHFTYDARGNTTSETDPLGNTTFYTYESFGGTLTSGPRFTRQRTVTDPLGNTTTNDYDGRGNLLSTIDPLGNATSFGYDGAGNLSSLTNPLGHATQFTYDGAGNVLTETDAEGNVTTNTYDLNGRRLTEKRRYTNAQGQLVDVVTRTEYDDEGRVTKVIDALGGESRTVYNAAGQEVERIDALGRTTKMVYDDRGQLLETIYPDDTPGTDADNPRTKTEYDAKGQQTASIDELGRRTEMVYDEAGRVRFTIYPDATPANANDNPRTETVYDAAGQVLAQIDERGNRTEFRYDLAGRQIETILPDDTPGDLADNPRLRTEYDQAGRAVRSIDPLGHATRTEYDDAGRPTKRIFDDGTFTITTLDDAGRLVAQTDQNGITTEYEYDRLGRLTAVLQPAVIDGVTNALVRPRTEYEYDELGNHIVQRDARGRETRYEYDPLGRRVATVLPMLERSTTEYDVVGRVESTTDNNGDTITFEYDARDRLITKTFEDDSFVTFSYTLTGQRETYNDARGTTEWQYDERDRLIARIEPDGIGIIAYEYDAAGNRTRATTPTGPIQYTFDEQNRLETVTDPLGGLTQYFYDAAGRLLRTEQPNGTVERREYDALNRPRLVEHSNTSGSFASFTYELDATGNRTAITELDGRRTEYDYDDLYRLVDERIFDAANGDRTIGYKYDLVGNRLARHDSLEGTTDYEYNANDELILELLAGDETRYAYDDNGNTLTKTKSGVLETEYAWDFENRLIAADTNGDGSFDVTNRYDADGIRVAQVVSGDETRFLIDSVQPYQQVVEEYTPGGIIKVSYVHGLDLISQTRAGEQSIFHTDALGSTRALTNNTGLVTDRYLYDAFGRTIGQVGSTGNVYLFAGEQRDGALGMDYLRARWLATESAHFTSRDSVAGKRTEPASRHLYNYAYGDPVNRIDPSGHFVASDATAAVGIVCALAGIQLAASAAISSFGSGRVEWRAITLTAKLTIGDEAGAVMFMVAESPPIPPDGHKALVLNFVSLYGASISKSQSGGELEATVSTAQLKAPAFFLRCPEVTFAGAAIISTISAEYAHGGVAGFSSSYGQIGFGVGKFSGLDLGVSSSVGLSGGGDLLFGVSVPWTTRIGTSFSRFDQAYMSLEKVSDALIPKWIAKII